MGERVNDMKPRERVLIALNHGQPDRIPWVENGIDEPLQIRLMGGAGFTPGDLCRKLGLDGFGGTFPLDGGFGPPSPREGAEGAKASYYFPQKVTFDFFNTYLTETGDPNIGHCFLTTRLLKSEDSLRLFDSLIPDPDHPARYERVERWIRKYREDFAVFARLDLGAGATIQSMGLEGFSYTLADNPRLIHRIHEKFSEWAIRAIGHLNESDFDFFWVMDDLAWNGGPFMSPKTFREFFMPHMVEVARTIKKPWVFHSDGNITLLLDDLVKLGMNALHPIQPDVMDIAEVKKKYGDRLCLIGNIDLHYTLTLGKTEEVTAEVEERIRAAAKNGGYIISSAMTLADYCKPENVLAMADAIRSKGIYPVV
jgi:uroporphyrinogen decarboxylase